MVLSNREINDPTLLKRKENARDYTTNLWQEPSRNIEPLEQAFEGIEEYDYADDPRTGWRFYNLAQGNLSLSSPIVLVHKLGTQQLDDKKLEFLAFFTV